MTRTAAYPFGRTDDREARVPRARAATTGGLALAPPPAVSVPAPSVPTAELAVVTVRTRLASFLQELTTVPGTPQLAVLRDRAEALDRAVAAPARDRAEIDTRWARLLDALGRFCLPGTVGHDADLAGIAPTVAAVR